MYLIKSKNDHHKAYTRRLENGKVVYIPAKGVTPTPGTIGLGRTGDKPHGKLVWSGRNADMDYNPLSNLLKKAAATAGQSARPSSRTDHGPRTKVLPKPALEALEDQTYFMGKKIPPQNDAIKIIKASRRHAPKGGEDDNGKHYRGGEFTPTKSGVVQISIPKHMRKMDDADFILAAKAYAREHHEGKTVENVSDHSKILIPWQGIKHSFARDVTRNEAAAALKLDEVIRTAKKAYETIDKKSRKSILSVHVYRADIEVEGRRVGINIVIREAADGKRYYDHSELERPAGLSGKLGKSQGSLQPCTGRFLVCKKIPPQQDAIKIKKAIPRLFLLRKAARTLDGKIDFNGLQISIETGRSRSRAWKNPHDGTEGMSRMWLPYGYIKGTLGVDGDHLDCFVGPDRTAPNVYIITTRKAPDFTEIDEQKCFLGVESEEEAKRVFHASYDDPRFFDSMEVMPFEEFKEKIFTMKGQMIKSHVRAYTRHSASGAAVQVKEHDDSRRREFDKMHIGYHLTSNKAKIEKEGFKTGKSVGIGGETSRIYTSDDPKYLEGLADHLNTVRDILNSKQHTKAAVEYCQHNADSMKMVHQLFNLYSKRLGRPLTEKEETAVIAFSGPAMKFPEIKPKFGKELNDFMRGNKFEVIRTRSRNAVSQSEIMGGERAHKEGDVFLDDYHHFTRHHNNPDTPIGEFGAIPEEVATSAGIPAGPIRLMHGRQIDKHRGFGREHIAVQHGKEIREAGYKSEEEFVQDVVRNFNAIYDVGNGRIALTADGKEGQKIHIIEARYSKGQKFYTVVTGYIATRPKFSEQRHKLLWKRVMKALASHLYILKKRMRKWQP